MAAANVQTAADAMAAVAAVAETNAVIVQKVALKAAMNSALKVGQKGGQMAGEVSDANAALNSAMNNAANYAENPAVKARSNASHAHHVSLVNPAKVAAQTAHAGNEVSATTNRVRP